MPYVIISDMEITDGVKGQPTMFFGSHNAEERKSLDAIVISLRSRRHPPVVPVKKQRSKKKKANEV